MSREQKKGPALEVGIEPRVNLLPPEVALAQRAKSIRRGMVAVVVAVALVVAAGYGGAWYLASVAQSRLALENARTQDLLAMQTQYVEVRTTTERLLTAQAAVLVGSSTEIDLASLLRELASKLPAGASIASVSGDTATPLDPYSQSITPLQATRVGTINLVIRTAGINDVRDWLMAISTLDFIADAMPGTVTLQADGAYLSAVTIHVNEQALAHRFVAEDGSFLFEAEPDDAVVAAPAEGDATDASTTTEAGADQ